MKRQVYRAPLNFPPNRATIGPVSVGLMVTAAQLVNSIECVPSRTAKMLTKRRAVDFCRVATAMCPRPVTVVA